MAKQDGYVRYTIRMPAPLYKSIADAAGEKSVNAEIIARLETAEFDLRDRFAMAALTGICSNDYSLNSIVPEQVAAWAYQFADAMLAAREAR